MSRKGLHGNLSKWQCIDGMLSHKTFWQSLFPITMLRNTSNLKKSKTCNNHGWLRIFLVTWQRAENLLVRYITMQVAENNVERAFIEDGVHTIVAQRETHVQHRRTKVSIVQVTRQCTVHFKIFAWLHQHVRRRQYQICQHSVMLMKVSNSLH